VSFDLAIRSAARPLDPDQALRAYQRLAEGEEWSSVLPEDPRIGPFVRALGARWPDLDSLPESEVDASPWSGGFELSPAHAVVFIRWSRCEEIAPVVIATALQPGLFVLDPQEGILHSPDGSERPITPVAAPSLVCERCGKPIEAGEPYAEASGGRV